MCRLGIAAALAILAALAAHPAPAETKSTANRSIIAGLSLSSEDVQISGAGCAIPASRTLSLPADVFDVQVREPVIGARNLDARITDISVQGNLVNFTAIGDGPQVCDAEGPPDVPWSLSFGKFGDKLDIAFKQRVTVAVFDHIWQTIKVRPRRVTLGLAFSARRVRWKQYGGRKSVGNGVFKSLIPCAGGCSDNGTRVKVVLSRPAHCPGLTLSKLETGKAVFYGKVALVLRERLGILKPGREWVSYKPLCASGVKPIPIR